MGLLLHRPQRAEVRAIAASTLLVLDGAKFLRLLKRSKATINAVQESAIQCGIPLEKLSADLQKLD